MARVLIQENIVEIFGYSGKVMMHGNHGLALAFQLFQDCDDRLFGGRIDPGKGLVQQIQIRPLRQRTRQKHPLLLTTGQLPDLAVGETLPCRPGPDRTGAVSRCLARTRRSRPSWR